MTCFTSVCGARVTIVTLVWQIQAFSRVGIAEIQSAEVAIVAVELHLRDIRTTSVCGVAFADGTGVPVVAFICGICAVACLGVAVIEGADIVIDAGFLL